MILVYMLNERLCAILKPRTVSVNNSITLMIEAVNGCGRYRLDCSRNRCSKVAKRVSTVFASVVLGSTPKPFNEVGLAVRLGVEDNSVTSSSDQFLQPIFLVLEILL